MARCRRVPPPPSETFSKHCLRKYWQSLHWQQREMYLGELKRLVFFYSNFSNTSWPALIYQPNPIKKSYVNTLSISPTYYQRMSGESSWLWLWSIETGSALLVSNFRQQWMQSTIILLTILLFCLYYFSTQVNSMKTDRTIIGWR